MKITAEQCVMALKRRDLNSTARALADYMGSTDSRAVATALRQPVRDGRVKIRYTRGLGFGAEYRFVRLKAKVAA
jgi:hypothetical protein